MTDPYAHGTPAGDDHTWIRPDAAPCPNCPCCTARLCEKGQSYPFGCWPLAAPEDQTTVKDCPCSTETTEGTEAHRAAQVRATKLAERAATRKETPR